MKVNVRQCTRAFLVKICSTVYMLCITYLFFLFQNSPKYISCINPSMELHFQYKVHVSLDVVEEKLQAVSKPIADVTKEQYLGLLYSTEEHKMLVYCLFFAK